MALAILANDLLTKRYLEVNSDGVIYYEGAVTGSKRSFRFGQIESILMSPENRLSFQVGEEVFSIPVQPGIQNHDLVVATLVQEVKRSGGMIG